MNERIVADVLRKRAAAAPDELLVKVADDWATTGEVDRRSDQVAGALAELGLSKGDRIAYLVPNRPEFIDFFFGSAKLGVIQVPINTFLKGDFLRHQLVDSGARILVADRAGVTAVSGLIEHTAVERVILLDEPEDADVPVPCTTMRELRTLSTPAPQVDLRASDLVSVVYTSGTTGPSKGCMLSNGYYTATPKLFQDYHWIEEGERIFTPFQLFHASGQAILFHALMVPGASICYEAWFTASNCLPRAQAENADVLWCQGPMGMAILNQPPRADDAENSIRMAVMAGMPGPFQDEFEKRFGITVAGEIYGQTECLGASLSPVGGKARHGTMGRPSPHLDVQIVNDDDEVVPQGEIGEIVIRPRQPNALYSGYWANPEATTIAWSNLWHHTGDLAYSDPEGYLTFVDRKKDSMRRRGENVSSFELEASINSHPQISQSAVCGLPSQLGEDDIKVSIVWKGKTPPTPDELFEFFTANLPYFAIPRYVEIRDSMPLTEATNRVRKHILREEGVTPQTWDLDQLGFSVSKSARR